MCKLISLKLRESIVQKYCESDDIKWLNRSDTVWRDTLEITEKTKPVWRIL